MAASDHLGPMFHGTKADLMPGDIIDPGSDGRAWASKEPWYAAHRAMDKFSHTTTPGRGTPTERPRIYTVEPLGQAHTVHEPGMIVDPSKGDTPHVASHSGLLVTGEHTPSESEWDGYLAKAENRKREAAGTAPLSAIQQQSIFKKRTAGKLTTN